MSSEYRSIQVEIDGLKVRLKTNCSSDERIADLIGFLDTKINEYRLKHKRIPSREGLYLLVALNLASDYLRERRLRMDLEEALRGIEERISVWERQG